MGGSSPNEVVEAIANVVGISGGSLEPFPDGADVLPGAETHISADRTVMLVRQFDVQTDTYRSSVWTYAGHLP
jgi:hypothetical protein